jgi:energy-coupling factor transporter ATP-binding protein EcfA2
MGASVLPRTPVAEYQSTVDRVEEMARLEAQARKRKCMLLFGPEGVGKSRLLRQFARSQPLALHVSEIQSPREFMLSLCEALRGTGVSGLHVPLKPITLSTNSLKGVVHKALDRAPFLIALDHVAGPSRVVVGIIKYLNYYGRTPIVFAARTPHMEDIGALQPMCADRSERTELKNLPLSIAKELARREVEKTGLWASNLEPAIHSLVEWSEGNPGSIIQIVKMAHLPQYRMGDQIKAHILYLDYRMGRR